MWQISASAVSSMQQRGLMSSARSWVTASSRLGLPASSAIRQVASQSSSASSADAAGGATGTRSAYSALGVSAGVLSILARGSSCKRTAQQISDVQESVVLRADIRVFVRGSTASSACLQFAASHSLTVPSTLRLLKGANMRAANAWLSRLNGSWLL